MTRIRYNETDRAPLITLSSDDVESFYEHANILQRVMAQHEVVIRLEPGESLQGGSVARLC